jgi:predicted NBD/HSP70 family sugar kinase
MTNRGRFAVFGTQMITLVRGRFGLPASQVIEQTRAFGPISRDELVRRTGLSSATVNRTVAAMLRAGLLAERPDEVMVGANGRPGIPVEVDGSSFATLGFHLGHGVDTVAIGDLAGRVLAQRRITRPLDSAPDLAALAQVSAGLLGALPERAPLAAGLVAPWLDLGLDRTALGEELGELLGLDVSTAEHVAAIAATEFLHRRAGTGGVTLYVYARNTVGFAIAVDKGAVTEVSRVGSLTHFPAGPETPCDCGGTGHLAANYSDHALVARAVGAGALMAGATIDDLISKAGSDSRARALLDERAVAMGRVAAIVRDMVSPHRVVLVGQGFTAYPPALAATLDAFRAQSAGAEIELSVTRFGGGIQAAAACTVALGPIYDDPLGLAPTDSTMVVR